MTQNEFIKKLEQICRKNETSGFVVIDCEQGVEMSYVNHQTDETVNEIVDAVGFDENGDFNIVFSDGCTAYDEDLECNSEDAWSLLWSLLLEDVLGFDEDSHGFKAGDAVYWNDPAIDDYPEEEREEALKRRFVIFDISGEIISISDTYTTAEVYADELEHIS
jgi:hypothetical protein